MTREPSLEGNREGPTALDKRKEHFQQNGGIRKHHGKVKTLDEEMQHKCVWQ